MVRQPTGFIVDAARLLQAVEPIPFQANGVVPSTNASHCSRESSDNLCELALIDTASAIIGRLSRLPAAINVCDRGQPPQTDGIGPDSALAQSAWPTLDKGAGNLIDNPIVDSLW